MHHSTGADARRARACGAKGVEEMVMSMIEQYPIDRKSMRVSARVGKKKCVLPKLRSFSLSQECKGVDDIQLVMQSTEEKTVPIVFATMEDTPAASGNEEQRHSTAPPCRRVDLGERVKKETLRCAHRMIAEQLRARKAELQLQQWANRAGGSSFRKCVVQSEEGMTPVTGGTKDESDAEFLMQASTTEGMSTKDVGNVAPLVSIRGITAGGPICASKKNEEDLQRHQTSTKGTLLRRLLDQPKHIASLLETKEVSVLQGNGIVTKESVSVQYPRRGPASVFLKGESVENDIENTRKDEAAGLAVRRLIGEPNHDRGLYAGLKAMWERSSKARALARLLFGKRARSMSWWRIAGVRDGLLAAAQALGLSPAMYQALLSQWTAMGNGAAQAFNPYAPFRAGEAPLDSRQGVLFSSGMAETANLLFPGDENLLDMLGLVQQLGELEARLHLSPEEIARLMELDSDALRQELGRLLGHDVTQFQLGSLFSDDAATHSEGHALLQEMVMTMLRERWRASNAKNGDYKMDVVSGWERSARSRKTSSELARRRGESEILTAAGFHPSLSRLGAYNIDVDSMTPEERAAYLRAKEYAAGRSGSDGPFTYLPPLVGPDTGAALDGWTRDSAALHRRVIPVKRRSKDPLSLLDETLSDDPQDPFGMTQKPVYTKTVENDDDTTPDGVYRGPEWWKKKQRKHGSGMMGFESDDDENKAEDEGKVAQAPSQRSSVILVDSFLPSRQRRLKQEERDAKDGAALEQADEGSVTLCFTELGAPVRFPKWKSGEMSDSKMERGSYNLHDGKMSLRRPESENRSRVTSGSERWVPLDSLRREGDSMMMRPLSDNSRSRGDNEELDEMELSSFLYDDDELMMFFATFPEEEEHVRLRMEAKGVLYELDDTSSLLVNYATKMRAKLQPGLSSYQQRHSGLDRKLTVDAETEQMMQLKVDIGKLRLRFQEEAREEYADLWSMLQDLRKQVLAQETFIETCSTDLHNLSYPAPGAQQDAFALELTNEVNKYAKTHRLDPRQLRESADRKKDYATAVCAYLESFALTRGRHHGHDVGCQCNPEDLGYVDEHVRRTEEQMEDLYFHARGLLSAIRLTIIAVANVMGFHASLELESTCRHCFCIFDAPRTLWPCGHTFCHQCLPGMLTEMGELLCDECGSVCEVGYTPNIALELLATYQVMQHDEYGDEDDEEDDLNKTNSSITVHRSTVEGVLAALLRDLMNTQNTLAGAPRADAHLQASQSSNAGSVPRPQSFRA